MSPWDPSDWSPSPELLAAYFDGELAGNPEKVRLRRQVEAWVAAHPEAREELSGHRRLAQAWQETSPPEPAEEVWHKVRARLVPSAPPPRARTPAVRRWAAALVGAAAVFALAVWIWNLQGGPAVVLTKSGPPAPPPAPEVEVFAVATASEVTILRVDGADTGTLAVGELPVKGPLELARPGEVLLTSIQPDARDNMVPRVLHRPAGPMIWAPAETEDAAP